MVKPIITLTTDFGLVDPYVAAMKGAILTVNPQAIIVDVSHAVRPQAIEQGAFLLGCAWPYFPRGSIHVAVVDPGVGTERRALAVRTPAATFVGPDNGLLSPALPDEARRAAGGHDQAVPVRLPEGYRAVSLTNGAHFRPSVSSTFHGRDIFAPVAGHISLGVPLEELGPAVEEVLALAPFRARRQPDGSLRGRVIHIDVFGNLVTDVRCEDLPTEQPTVEVADRRIVGLSRTYQGGAQLLAVIGSSGYLEIAAPKGSAAKLLKAGLGLPVLVRP
ncbi:MAG: SAM hydrolase/SAM-dependent halogenase family protein [Dehalococcoidia bacterium]